MRKVKTFFDGIDPKEYGIASILLEVHAVFVEPEPCKDDIPWTGMYTKTYWTPEVGFRSLIADEYDNPIEGLITEKDHFRRIKDKTITRFKIELQVLDGRHRNLLLKHDKNLSFKENLKRALLVRSQFTKI